MIGAIASRLWEWIKMGLMFAALVFLMLAIDYGENCTSYRAPWCDFLDATTSWIPPEWVTP